jgi:hypothetical protein
MTNSQQASGIGSSEFVTKVLKSSKCGPTCKPPVSSIQFDLKMHPFKADNKNE